MRLVEAGDVKVSEMALTGEPEDLAKSCKLNFTKREPGKLTPQGLLTVTDVSGRSQLCQNAMPGQKMPSW